LIAESLDPVAYLVNGGPSPHLLIGAGVLLPEPVIAVVLSMPGLVIVQQADLSERAMFTGVGVRPIAGHVARPPWHILGLVGDFLRGQFGVPTSYMGRDVVPTGSAGTNND
jgi:hypothetical protein